MVAFLSDCWAYFPKSGTAFQEKALTDNFTRNVAVQFTLNIEYRTEFPNLLVRFWSDDLPLPESDLSIPFEWFVGEQGKIDPALLIDFESRVFQAFEMTQYEALIPVLCQHFMDVARLVAVADGKIDETARQAIKVQAEQHHQEALERLQAMMSGLGRSSRHWTAITLSVAIRDAKAKLGPSEGFDYQNIWQKIRERHPRTAPSSPEALKKLVQRLGVNWKTLKAETSAVNQNDTPRG